MKSIKWIIAGVVACALIFQLARTLGPVGEGSADPSETSASAATGISTGANAEPSPIRGGRSKSDRSGVRRPAPSSTDDAESGPPVYLTAGRELAQVNGVVLTLKDLMPLPDALADREHVMTTVRYEFLLNRAVERELTFQTAESLGVGLDETQVKALQEAAERRRNHAADKVVFDDLGDNPRNAAFQQRDFAALLLQSSLAKKSGVTSPNVGAEQVRAHYEANRAEFAPLPADATLRETAWREMESTIRAKLAPAVRKQHQEQLAQFIEKLKEGAEITTASW